MMRLLLGCLWGCSFVDFPILACHQLLLRGKIDQLSSFYFQFLVVHNIDSFHSVNEQLDNRSEANHIIYYWLLIDFNHRICLFADADAARDVWWFFVLSYLQGLWLFAPLLIKSLLLLVFVTRIIDQAFEPIIYIVVAHFLQIQQVHLYYVF